MEWTFRHEYALSERAKRTGRRERENNVLLQSTRQRPMLCWPERATERDACMFEHFPFVDARPAMANASFGVRFVVSRSPAVVSFRSLKRANSIVMRRDWATASQRNRAEENFFRVLLRFLGSVNGETRELLCVCVCLCLLENIGKFVLCVFSSGRQWNFRNRKSTQNSPTDRK